MKLPTTALLLLAVVAVAVACLAGHTQALPVLLRAHSAKTCADAGCCGPSPDGCGLFSADTVEADWLCCNGLIDSESVCSDGYSGLNFCEGFFF
mmetsp:Transcript_10120/g.25042  ORF Transcript_10120/g.25042 Transcript_10120/m.25042 type:complete len:94 (-) Transcript_10120:223-504(-)